MHAHGSTWRRPLAALAASGAGLALALAVPAATAAASPTLLETLTVANASPGGVVARTVLDPSSRYVIAASGTVSDWCAASATSSGDCSNGSPLAIGAGVDAMYCYATWRCPTPEPWRQLRVNGLGIDEFAGVAQPVYTATHTYQVAFTGKRGSLTFSHWDSSLEDNSGAFTVQIFKMPVAPTRFRLVAHANYERGRTGLRFNVSGAGVVQPDGSATGLINDRHVASDYTSMGAIYRVTAAAPRLVNRARGLVLTVQVVEAHGGVCRRGTTGTITIWDDPKLLANGETGDGVYIDMPRACRSHGHHFNNLDNGAVSPPRGGRGGGIEADVSISGGSSGA